MIPALIVFILTYILMLSFQKYRPWIALGSAVVMMILGAMGYFKMTPMSALKAVDYNVLLMISATMCTVMLFIESRMPARLAEMMMEKVPNVMWAVTALSLFAGIVSAFVDNVATLLMVAPVGLAISRKLKISPVPVLIAISVSSNLQGAATLVGDTTSILLGGFAHMNFMDFFWMDGKPSIFFSTELGALAATLVLMYLFRNYREKVEAKVETEVDDLVPSWLMIGTVLLLICMSFVPEPKEDGFLKTLHGLRSGLSCVLFALIGLIRQSIKEHSGAPFVRAAKSLDTDTLLLLFGLFMVIEGIRSAGVIDAVAGIFHKVAGNNALLLYVLIVSVSVILSAFIDNIPYVATMLPVVQGIAGLMGVDPRVFYFGLLIGATLGGNLTPIGASANITAIGILRKNGETVTSKDFLRIGVPFTLTAVIVGATFIWIFWGIRT
ncbi:MAG: TRAP transporter large permease subunit [Oscillospiraceae bacterium]|nr:TRAP transporter large permease subunit [Oscillospiraceae bacterium]